MVAGAASQIVEGGPDASVWIDVESGQRERGIHVSGVHLAVAEQVLYDLP